jgi:hypothetical protein
MIEGNAEFPMPGEQTERQIRQFAEARFDKFAVGIFIFRHSAFGIRHSALFWNPRPLALVFSLSFAIDFVD